MRFDLHSRDGAARAGRVTTLHGAFTTPAFMPVGTYGTVKAMTPAQLSDVGAQIVLANTFHLLLRPGDETVASLGGLHGFMNWRGPILTDSGGFQVWSLGALRKVTEEGVHFKSPVNGDSVFLSPERSMQVQRNLGADIVMVFDECTAHPVTQSQARESMELSARWAARSRSAHAGSEAALFGIVQGGMYADLRRESLERLAELGFDGYAVGGLSVGESKDEMAAVLDALLPHMPHDRPRYLMGVGTPGRSGCRGWTRRGHVRLRVTDAQCTQWLSVHVAWRVEDSQCRAPFERRAARCVVRVLHVSRIFARVPASPRSLRRDSRQRVDDDPQLALLPDTDGSFARGH